MQIIHVLRDSTVELVHLFWFGTGNISRIRLRPSHLQTGADQEHPVQWDLVSYVAVITCAWSL